MTRSKALALQYSESNPAVTLILSKGSAVGPAHHASAGSPKESFGQHDSLLFTPADLSL